MTGGFGYKKNVACYNMSGFVQNLPELHIGRQYHACAGYINEFNQKVEMLLLNNPISFVEEIPVERSYYRRPSAIKNQRGESKIPSNAVFCAPKPLVGGFGCDELVRYGIRELSPAIPRI